MIGVMIDVVGDEVVSIIGKRKAVFGTTMKSKNPHASSLHLLSQPKYFAGPAEYKILDAARVQDVAD